MDIGQKLQEERMARGLSQRELAQRSGLTNGTISLIEKNKTSPSIASLKCLLDALPMSMSEFFNALDGDGEPKYFFAPHEFTELSPYFAGEGKKRPTVSLRQLGDAARHTLQVLHEVYPPGADTGPEFLIHQGEEAGVIVSGEIELTVGEQTRRLGAGEGYIFPSHLPHRFRNLAEDDCVIVSALTPPTF